MEGPVTFARHNLKAQGITCMNEVIPYVHYSRVVHIYSILHWSLHHQPAVYIMIQSTEPATPAVIVFCEFPVSLQEAVLGLKTPSPITVLSERGEGFFRLFVSVVPTLWKRADQKKKDRRKQYSGRRRQMQADADG